MSQFWGCEVAFAALSAAVIQSNLRSFSFSGFFRSSRSSISVASSPNALSGCSLAIAPDMVSGALRTIVCISSTGSGGEHFSSFHSSIKSSAVSGHTPML
jgi:hypothetical protein